MPGSDNDRPTSATPITNSNVQAASAVAEKRRRSTSPELQSQESPSKKREFDESRAIERVRPDAYHDIGNTSPESSPEHPQIPQCRIIKTTIYYVNSDGCRCKTTLSDDDGLFTLCRRNGAKCLWKDDDDGEIYNFHVLEHGSTYGLVLIADNRKTMDAATTRQQKDSEALSAGNQSLARQQHTPELVYLDYCNSLRPVRHHISEVTPLIPNRRERPDKYICPKTFWDHLLQTIAKEYVREDDRIRVPPLALVGCTRSGKTATLEEIARVLPDFLAAAKVLTKPTIIMVTFNDYANISANEQADPLQALCLRIAFALTRDRTNDSVSTYIHDFVSFREKNYTIDPSCIRKWMGKTPVVLLIDELNNLKELMTESPQAREFGAFLRDNFLALRNRYLIFSSHVLGAVTNFAQNVDSSEFSGRRIRLHCLPCITDLGDVMTHLLVVVGALEAIYYGLLPGLIYNKSLTHMCCPKQQAAVQHFNKRQLWEKEKWFTAIFTSVVSGDIKHVPSELHGLLTVRPMDLTYSKVNELAKVSWVPFILQGVLEEINLLPPDVINLPSSKTQQKYWRQRLKDSIAWLCSRLRDVDRGSGKGFEYLFCIVYLARCIANLPFGNLLPKHWTDEAGVIVRMKSYDHHAADLLFEDYKTWAHFKKVASVPTNDPAIMLYLPGHDKFKSFDVVVAFFKQGQMCEYRAFQMKEDDHNQVKHVGEDEIEHRFLLEGIQATTSTRKDGRGWVVLGKEDLNAFYGESGRYWTPQQCRNLRLTFNKAMEEKLQGRRPTTNTFRN